ncbi:MAG: NADH:flavin oxidoreductase [Thermoleophilia bacterium]
MPLLSDPLVTDRLTLKNRIVMPPMANDLSSSAGEVTEKHIKHYQTRAQAGVGLIIVEHSYIMPSGKMTRKQLGIYKDELTGGLRSLAGAIREAGAASAIQLTHAGANTTAAVCGCQPVGPSDVPVPGRDEIPRPLDTAEIGEIVEAYAQAARRAVEAGFDAIEIHGAHGFLLCEFVSPLMNRRADEYGGSTENRLRLPLEVIAAVRRQTGPDYPLFYRFGASDFIQGGLTLEEARQIAPQLTAAGIDFLDISGGMCGSRPKALADTQGYFVPMAESIKSTVDVPVIAVGGITDPAYANSVVADGRADLVAVGRALLKNPDWARQALEQI